MYLILGFNWQLSILHFQLLLNGTPKGIRTPAAEMKTQYPRPLDDGGLFWLGWLDSNQRCRSQSPVPYRLATPHCFFLHYKLKLESGSVLLSHRAAPIIPSALEDLTSVFEMGNRCCPSAITTRLLLSLSLSLSLS